VPLSALLPSAPLAPTIAAAATAACSSGNVGRSYDVAAISLATAPARCSTLAD